MPPKKNLVLHNHCFAQPQQYRLQQKRPDPTAERVMTPQLYVLNKYPLLTLEKTVPKYQNLKLESQETNGIYLFVLSCMRLLCEVPTSGKM